MRYWRQWRRAWLHSPSPGYNLLTLPLIHKVGKLTKSDERTNDQNLTEDVIITVAQLEPKSILKKPRKSELTFLSRWRVRKQRHTNEQSFTLGWWSWWTSCNWTRNALVGQKAQLSHVQIWSGTRPTSPCWRWNLLFYDPKNIDGSWACIINPAWLCGHSFAFQVVRNSMMHGRENASSCLFQIIYNSILFSQSCSSW